MGSPTLASRLLEAAELLLESRPRSAAFRRRAVSTAYYAVFHAIDKVCADFIAKAPSRRTEDYERVYRALDHGPLKNAFKQSPLKDSEALSRIGAIVVRLQAERHRADYSPPRPDLFPIEEAHQLVEQASEIVAEIEKLERDSDESRSLAISLLFKARLS